MISLYREGWHLGCSKGTAAKICDCEGPLMWDENCKQAIRAKGYSTGTDAQGNMTVTWFTGTCNPISRVFTTMDLARKSYG